ncbi:MAG: hydroxymethylglutaryl-CoA lyase [Bacteroidetes bacterium 4572_112]|nr:MAG: hydroxymethylglutaryl-CoA lyase [Bacteroidetes bacterium 4572_112]
MIKILETPRDALQGISKFIPTEQKAKYINALLNVGFDTVDFGSFVSPRAVPQMKDSHQVIELLNTESTNTQIVSTIGSLSGAKRAFEHDKIDGIVFPFSISESFLKKNINSNFDKVQRLSDDLIDLCVQKDKNLKFYIAMAFGNPYGDKWNTDILLQWTEKLLNMGVSELILADTTGDGTSENIAKSFETLRMEFPNLNPGVHLHTTPKNWHSKLGAAYNNGCRSFDTVIGGLGGCPMSGKALLGNLNKSFAHIYC